MYFDNMTRTINDLDKTIRQMNYAEAVKEKADKDFNAAVKAYFLERWNEYSEDNFHCHSRTVVADRAMQDIIDQVRDTIRKAIGS